MQENDMYSSKSNEVRTKNEHTNNLYGTSPE